VGTGETFNGVIGRTVAESSPWWPSPPAPPAGSPDVVIIVLDDVGFADLGCFGSDISTPTIDGLAERGLRYTNFHTTALCSPSRACLLTGRNHHSVGMGVVANWDTGFPGYRGRIAKSASTLAEMLRFHGYGTMAVGKWHLVPPIHTSAAGPYDDWPLQRGFDHFYGFLDGATNHWVPELVAGNQPIDPPDRPGYHLAEDLVDRAITLIRDQVSASPEKPFLLYLCFGTAHYPLHAPPAHINRYHGVFDDGWDVCRQRRLGRQTAAGIVPAGTELAPPNPGVPPWESLSADERRLCTRLQEAYAGMLDHTDAHLSRLVQYLAAAGRLDNTLLVLLSDNGASGEGGRIGSTNYMRYINALPEDLNRALGGFDDIGGPASNPMYPQGWAQAGNTPFKWYKQHTHAGGIRDPLIVSWPARILDRGGTRAQYHHVTDITPTVLEAIGVDAPSAVNGVAQQPVEGVSFMYTFDQKDVPSRKRVQYYEMLGHRAIWCDGWKAVTCHPSGRSFDADQWELYDLDRDASEITDLAGTHPDKLNELVDLWWREAEKHNVLPLDDRILERFEVHPPGTITSRRSFTYYPGGRVPAQAAADIKNVSHTIAAHVDRQDPATEGVLVSCGDRFAGWALFVVDNRLVYDYNCAGAHLVVSSDRPVPTGPAVLRYVFRRTGVLQGVGTLWIGDDKVGEHRLDRTLGVSLGTAGISVGRSALTPVSDAYVGAFPFTGRMDKVVIDLGDD
jgi:arylsulfatase